jgi:ATP-dependent DNA ligase
MSSWTGELAVPDERGHPDFEAVRRRSLIQRRPVIEAATSETPATLCPFDLLARDDEDLRSLPLLERKARRFDAVRDAPGIRAVRYLDMHGDALFKQAVALDLEGIVAKRADAPY